MIKRLLPLLMAGLSLTINGEGQNLDSSATFKRIGIKASYFGELVLHPGLAAGIDYTVYQKTWFFFHWDTELGFYHHKSNNNAFWVQTTLGSRFVSNFSGFIDVNLGVGYMISAPDGDVYVVDDSGNLSSKGRPYTSHFRPSISLMLGWDGGRKRNLPWIVQAGIEAYWQSHVNNGMLQHGAFKIGIIYRIKSQ